MNFELECGHTQMIRVVSPSDARHVKCDTCRTIKNVTKVADTVPAEPEAA